MKRLLTTAIATLTFAAPLAYGQSAAPLGNVLDQKAFDDGFGKLPTNVKSDTLTFNAKERRFVYKGNVEVTQGDMTLTSKVVEGTYTEQNQLQKLTARGDVIITKQDIRATSQLATYDAVSSIVTLTENPELQQKESALRADKIKIYLNDNRSEAEGDVRVTFVNDKGGMGLKPDASPTPAPQATPSAQKAKATPAPKSKQLKTPVTKKKTPQKTGKSKK